MKFLLIFMIISFHLISCGYSGVAQNKLHHEKQADEEQQQQAAMESLNEGLYDANDKVISLNDDTLNKMLLDKSYSTLLEFYNSYCGHCRRFAPVYKQLAEDMWPWRDIIKVMAIDCANDENNDMCRKYEVMAYPSLRYFSPHYKDNDDKNLGESIYAQDPDIIKSFIIHALINETNSMMNDTTTSTSLPSTWPNFQPITSKSINDLLKNLPNDIQYVFIIYEPENSILGSQLILDFNRYKTIRIRRVLSSDIASGFHLETFNQIGIVDRNSNLDIIPVSNTNFKNFQSIIKQFLKRKNIFESNIEQQQQKDTSSVPSSSASHLKSDGINHKLKDLNTIRERNKAIIDEVKKNKHAVYQSDLEHALRYSLFHEITKYNEINGEKLLALQRYINVLVRYNPLGENGQKFLQKLREYILQHNQEILGQNIQNELIELENKYSPIFSSSHWIGCQPSKPGYRGFTCGLWQLFHFMTVQAAENEKSTDPLEVLQAMHGYIKYFFGCSDCSNHFQIMAAKNKIWNTSSKDNAILWLWSAHNEVNRRLAGDETEDPVFPKIQFPSRDSCPECYKEQSTSPIIINVNNPNDINWDRTEVLLFLKRIHSPQNVSRFGIDDESVLPPTAEKLREKRLLGNVFSDLDMRMGIFLYIFCIGMMVIAVKLFLRKGYRKKIYSHDFLGKV